MIPATWKAWLSFRKLRSSAPAQVGHIGQEAVACAAFLKFHGRVRLDNHDQRLRKKTESRQGASRNESRWLATTRFRQIADLRTTARVSTDPELSSDQAGVIALARHAIVTCAHEVNYSSGLRRSSDPQKE